MYITVVAPNHVSYVLFRAYKITPHSLNIVCKKKWIMIKNNFVLILVEGGQKQSRRAKGRSENCGVTEQQLAEKE